MNMTSNILAIYDQASNDEVMSGLSWYPTAHEVAREASNVISGAGIIAALSPRLPWHRNIILARQCFDSPLNGGALGNSVRAANAIRNGAHPLDVLGGLKTRAFFDNIANPFTSRAVTVDVHAIRIAGITDRDSIGKGLYNEISAAYTDAAKYAGISPAEMQAITWVTYRRIINIWTHRKDK